MSVVAESPEMRRGFTLIELLCTVAIIAILLALLLPVLERARAQARRAACSSNLHNIGLAFSTWAHDHGDLLPMQVSTNQSGTREWAEAAGQTDVSLTFRHFQALSNELAVAQVLRCPADRQRSPAHDFTSLNNDNVSYWINAGAVFGRSDVPVAGDRNVRTSGRMEWTFARIAPGDAVEFSAELHGHLGNVLFGDGRVALHDGARLARALHSISNSPDVTLSLPRPDLTEITAARVENQNASGLNGGSTAAVTSIDPGGTTTNKSGPLENRPVLAVPGSRRGTTSRDNAARVDALVVYTKLDGTVATSAVPQHATRALDDHSQRAMTETDDPLVEFIQWLTRQAARYTYWLLALLLAALVAFELARRRARRKRRHQFEP